MYNSKVSVICKTSLSTQGDCHQALIDLQKGVSKHFSKGNRLQNDKSAEAKAQRLAHAKVSNVQVSICMMKVIS